MDYVDLMTQTCPSEIVEYVTAADISRDSTAPWPDGDFFGFDLPDACHVAALLYRSDGLARPVGARMASYFTDAVLRHFASVPEPDRLVIEDALRVLAEGDLPRGYLTAITRHGIDLREALAPHFPTRPTVELATPEAHQMGFGYLRYLTALGDREAEADLIEALVQEPNPGQVIAALNAIADLRMPNGRRVLRAFTEDGRQGLSATQIPGAVVADVVRGKLGMKPYEGPVQPLDALGRPVR